MKVIVDFDLCEGNARCVQAAPKVFSIDENDQLTVILPEPGEELREAVETAAALCPRRAVKISEP
jgi:ferredoxin